jgi:hypothetical protein
MGTPAKHGKKRKSTTTPTKSAPNSGRKGKGWLFFFFIVKLFYNI